ncbi:MAG: hypothetical protein Q9180_007971 [Flavoplaca navasiana]
MVVAIGAFFRSEWSTHCCTSWSFEGVDSELNDLSPPWVDINDAIRILGLENAMEGEVGDFLKFDIHGRNRSVYKDILPPFQDDSGLLMCGFCDLGFSSAHPDYYYQHAAAHYRGAIFITPCCLQPFSTLRAVRFHQGTVAKCRPEREDNNQRHGAFTALSKRLQSSVKASSWEVESIEHEWEVLAISVRYSGKNSQSEVQKKMNQLRRKYTSGFKAQVSQRFEFPQKTGGRSSCEPLWFHGEERWTDKNAASVTARLIQGRISPGSRLLFLCLGIDGLSSNLQWIMHLVTDFAPGEITLGFCTSKRAKSSELERVKVAGMYWSFYKLRKLRDVMRGDCEDARYERLVLILYCIQKAKQSGNSDYMLYGGGPGRMEITDGTQALLDDCGIGEGEEIELEEIG